MKKLLRILFNTIETAVILPLTLILGLLVGVGWLLCDAPVLGYKKLRAWAFRD